MRSITLEIRTIDGEDQIIPICADARCFARMLDSTVLTFDTVFCIRTLDYDVEFYPTRGANAVSHSHQPHPQVSGYPHPGIPNLGQTLAKPRPSLASLGQTLFHAGTDMRWYALGQTLANPRDTHFLRPFCDSPTLGQTLSAPFLGPLSHFFTLVRPTWNRHFQNPVRRWDRHFPPSHRDRHFFTRGQTLANPSPLGQALAKSTWRVFFGTLESVCPRVNQKRLITSLLHKHCKSTTLLP